MIYTKRKPFTVGNILVTEFLEPMEITQTQLAEAMGVQRRLVNEICNNKRAVTADTALMLSTVFDTTVDFWLNLQRQTDVWEALNNPERKARIERAHRLVAA